MNDDKILIEIAAYRDPELLNTVNSALIQADNPYRVCFSICYQSDDIKDYEKLLKIKNCKVKWLKDKETKGLCYARYLCEEMLSDEKYIYQIDSHMRFVKHWDTKLIEELLSLNDKKAIISFYPPNCTEEMMSLQLNDSIFDNPGNGGLMYITEFRDKDTPFVKIQCESLNKDLKRHHLRSAFISGGNFFSFSEVHKEVRHDKDMYFYGDELFMNIKLFTYGWNVYNSTYSYIYHQYNRKNQVFSKVDNAVENEKNKLLELLKNKNDKRILNKFNMGDIRTIIEYEEFSGINFDNRIIYLNAETGELENKKYIGKISYINFRDTIENKKYNDNSIIRVLIVDLVGDYKECINSSLEKAKVKERIKFIVGSVKKNTLEKEENCNVEGFLFFDKTSKYSEILSKISKNVKDGFVVIVDSSIRFLDGWDKYLIENIRKCGNSSALTNWVWETDEEEIKSLKPYINIEKKVTHFSNYIPNLIYDDKIDLKKLLNLHHTSIAYNGFIFFHSSILKKIPFDPNLSYEEQKYIYSFRLWTNGIDLYLPKLSYFVRIRKEEELNTENNNQGILSSLSGIHNYYSRNVLSDYPYGIGSKRTLWTWYNHLNINYDIENKDIV